ncbi:hypothetical protein C7450_104112 [Chelatococcus asaccharovorans]|uniref:Uncharacterized protein n=1 Tax=Chelatococcus asaccharovorans TaxID=28210 RepID=A0A2V3U8N6_9HYPH|nr:hypothetical protein C7450_104112 [Chelatococcus asaccharovorans]
MLIVEKPQIHLFLPAWPGAIASWAFVIHCNGRADDTLKTPSDLSRRPKV